MFKRRKKISDKIFLEANEIKNLDDFKEKLVELGIRVPADLTEIKKLFPKKKKKAAVVKTTNNPKKKRGRKKVLDETGKS